MQKRRQVEYNCTDNTYVLTIQSNPVGQGQSVDQHGKESLVVGVRNARQVGVGLCARVHGVVPAHIARHNVVVVTPVLNIVRERVVIGVGGGFRCIYKKRKNAKERRAGRG